MGWSEFGSLGEAGLETFELRESHGKEGERRTGNKGRKEGAALTKVRLNRIRRPMLTQHHHLQMNMRTGEREQMKWVEYFDETSGRTSTKIETE
jgi:hypothetical protein